MRRLTTVLGMVLAAAWAPAAGAAPPATCPVAMPLAEVAGDAAAPDGFAATGWTVKRGTEPEPFDVQVLGVLDDGVAVGVDMILVKITDADLLAGIGGIWAGMSGSPVHTPDGRLVGAVAYGLSAGPSAIGGLAAAEDMQRVLAYSDTAAMRASVRLPASLRSKAGVASPAVALNRLRVPFGVSGLSHSRVQQLAGRLDGAIPYAGGAASAAPGDPADIVPGGNFAAAVSYGYLSGVGLGTTTFVCNGRAVAFGHPMLFDGPTSLSAHSATAITIQDDPTFVPFKLGNPGGVVGTLDQDRLSGISALLGTVPRAAEVASRVNGNPPAERPRTFVNRTQDVPGVAGSHLLGAIDGEIDRIGAGTAEIGWTARLHAGGRQYVVRRTNRFADRGDIAFVSTFELVEQLGTLTENPHAEVTVDTVDLSATVDGAFREYRITGLQRWSGSEWLAVEPESMVTIVPGTPLRVRALLAGFRTAAPVAPVEFSFPIPEDVEGASGSLDIRGSASGGGGGEGFFLFGPEPMAPVAEHPSLPALIEALETAPRNDELVAELRLASEERRSPPVKLTQRVAEVVTGSFNAAVGVRPPDEPRPSNLRLNLLGRKSLALSKALSRGIKLTIRAGAPGRLVLRASVSKKAARRLGLKRRVVATLSRRLRTGRTAVRLKLTKPARRKLRGARAVKLTLEALLIDARGNRRVDRMTIRLRR